MKITALTCVKNEGPFLIEWIAFNRVLGVSDFLFYSNDCTDATDTLLDKLAEQGVVTHLPNPAEGRNYQMEALKDAQTPAGGHRRRLALDRRCRRVPQYPRRQQHHPRPDRRLRRPAVHFGHLPVHGEWRRRRPSRTGR